MQFFTIFSWKLSSWKLRNQQISLESINTNWRCVHGRAIPYSNRHLCLASFHLDMVWCAVTWCAALPLGRHAIFDVNQTKVFPFWFLYDVAIFHGISFLDDMISENHATSPCAWWTAVMPSSVFILKEPENCMQWDLTRVRLKYRLFDGKNYSQECWQISWAKIHI